MKKVAPILITLISTTLCIASCNSESTSINSTDSFDSTSTSIIESDDKTTATIRIYKNDADSDLKGRFIPPDHVEMMHSYTSLSGYLSNNRSVCPSVGDVNILVIPVHIPGSERYKTDKVREDIEKVFFSENDDDMGFYSLKEYFYESSFGKLNFGGTVTDWYDASLSGIESPMDIESGTNATINKILYDACVWLINEKGMNLQDYDQNKDGLIDAVWLVYDHLDSVVEQQYILANYDGAELDPSGQINQDFWNFTGFDNNWAAADYTSDPTAQPAPSGYSWASFDMMYKNYCNIYTEEVTYNGTTMEVDVPAWDSQTKLDSHTFIHETGHLLGLHDFYATDDANYNPTGKCTMMDENIGDLDSYSKMVLGWVTPFVVYGSSEIIIPKAALNENAVIVIPYNFEEISDEIEQTADTSTYKYSFNPFSEYIMIDLYSPDGVNEQDAFGPFINTRTDISMPDTLGVRIYHVDARIFKMTVIPPSGEEGSSATFIYGDDYIWDGNLTSLNENNALIMGVSNDRDDASQYQLDDAFSYYDEIRLLEASGYNSFSNNGATDASSLWNTNTEHFSIETFGLSFFNANYAFNSGTDLPFKIGVTEIKEVE